jgi:Domain of unknown function (DU1801)
VPKAAAPKTPEDYIASLDEPQRAEAEDLHRFIRKTVPKLEPYILERYVEGSVASAVIGYGRYHFRYASGREGELFVVGLASRKQYISLYVIGEQDGGYIAEAWASRLGKVDVGKTCIRINRIDDINRPQLAKLLRAAASSQPPGAADA